MTKLLTEPAAAAFLGLRADVLTFWRYQDQGPPFIWLDGVVHYFERELKAFAIDNKADLKKPSLPPMRAP
jgi:hypothetical protein